MKWYEETQCAIPMPVNADDMLQRRRFKMQKNWQCASPVPS
jgi:hypothetical protein